MAWGPQHKRSGQHPQGLKNLDNTCYLNSVLQCLAHTPPLVQFCLAAQHSSLFTLGQAGMVSELIKIIETMRKKPPRNITMRRKDWDPTLEPDVVIHNAVLNGCIPSSQWKGVFWVFDRMRYGCIEPNATSYGLAMEVSGSECLSKMPVENLEPSPSVFLHRYSSHIFTTADEKTGRF